MLADNEIEQLMRRVDFDHNGTVDLSEFITTLMDWDQVQSESGWQVTRVPVAAHGGSATAPPRPDVLSAAQRARARSSAILDFMIHALIRLCLS